MSNLAVVEIRKGPRKGNRGPCNRNQPPFNCTKPLLTARPINRSWPDLRYSQASVFPSFWRSLGGLPEAFLHPGRPRVRVWMSAPKCLFVKFLTRDVRTNDPGDVRGISGPKTFSLGCFLILSEFLLKFPFIL